MKKRILSVLLVLVMIVTLAPTSALAYRNDFEVSYAVPGGYIIFDKLSRAIVYCDSTVTEAVIPSEIDGVAVQAIRFSAFNDCTNLKSVTIPNSMDCIDGSVFENCTGLVSVKIPNSVTFIGKNAFRGCKSLTSITIPSNVTRIENSTFESCESLTSIVIPNGVTSIGEFAFANCTNLASITIPDSVTSIGREAFMGCAKLTGSITIPYGMTSIGEFTFAGCANLTSVTIPDSVTVICERAFSGCSSLTDVYYSGSEAQWKKIDNYGHNDELFNARIHYNSVSPVTPTGISDVAYGSYCYDAVQWAVEKGITNGTDSTHFSPNRGCTRAQVVTFLWRAAGSPDVSTDVSFVDVSTSSVYYKAIKWAVANGITKGTDATHFSPNATCTRGQVVTFMHRAANEPYVIGMGGFVDVAYGSYCYNAVQWAVANGITKGTDATHFSPNATCTRGQVVTFLYRAQ